MTSPVTSLATDSGTASMSNLDTNLELEAKLDGYRSDEASF